MKVLVITWNYPPRKGGIEYLVENLCAGLEKSHELWILTAWAPGAQPGNQRVLRSPVSGLLAFAGFAMARGAQLLRRNPEIEIVFGGSAMVAPIVWVLSRLFGRRAAVQVHGLDLIYPDRLYQALCVSFVKRCERVIANSSYTAALATGKGVPVDRLQVIPPGIDPHRFQNTETELAGHDDFRGKRVLLFVGRITKRKGLEPFIEKSLPAIVAEVPTACLVVAGGDPIDSLTDRSGRLRPVEALIEALHLERHVKLLGSVTDEELISLYRLCDLVVLPAIVLDGDVEGFGIVLLEAAAAGKPAIATRVGGIPDAVEDGRSGILVDAGDYQGMSRSIVELLRNDRKRREMGEYARRRVQEEFSWERITTRYVSALETPPAAPVSGPCRY